MLLDEFHVRPRAWTLEHMLWLWNILDQDYSVKTAYVYKTIAREILNFYGQWSYISEQLPIMVPEEETT